MYRQLQHYRDSVSAERGDTFKIDLPKTGILSFVYIDYTMAQAAGAPYQASGEGVFKLINILEDISVVANGRADIITAPGTVLQAFNFLDQGITAYDKIREYSAATQTARLGINFGRKMWDPKFGLNLGAFDNVELQIKNGGTSTYWASTATVDVWLGWLRGAGVPGGDTFLQKQLWREYTGAQDKREYLELPTGLPIRRVMLQPLPAYDSTTGMCDTAPNNVLYDIKFTLQNGILTVFDGRWLDLAHLNLLELGYEHLVHGSSYHMADYGFDIGLGDVRGFASVSGARDGAVSAVIPTREGDLSNPTQKLEAYEADSPVDYLARGAAYQNCVHFAFDTDGELDNLLNPAKGAMGIAELELHCRNASSVASSTVRVALDRLVRARELSA